MKRKFILRLVAGILSSLVTIMGASSVFKVARPAEVIAVLAGAFGLGAVVTLSVYEKRKMKA